MAIKSSGLTPGDVVTVWWVAIQNHQNCAKNPCTPKEAMGSGMENDTVASLAASGVVEEDGTISLAGFLPVGEVEGNFYDTTFHSPETAEYHLPVVNHGPLDPKIAGDMLSSFRAGCSDESLPDFYPETALADGAKGDFDCKDRSGSLVSTGRITALEKEAAPRSAVGAVVFRFTERRAARWDSQPHRPATNKQPRRPRNDAPAQDLRDGPVRPACGRGRCRGNRRRTMFRRHPNA